MLDGYFLVASLVNLVVCWSRRQLSLFQRFGCHLLNIKGWSIQGLETTINHGTLYKHQPLKWIYNYFWQDIRNLIESRNCFLFHQTIPKNKSAKIMVSPTQQFGNLFLGVSIHMYLYSLAHWNICTQRYVAHISSWKGLLLTMQFTEIEVVMFPGIPPPTLD